MEEFSTFDQLIIDAMILSEKCTVVVYKIFRKPKIYNVFTTHSKSILEILSELKNSSPVAVSIVAVRINGKWLDKDYFDNFLSFHNCRVCSCNSIRRCEEGCYWIEKDLCSSCVETDAIRKENETEFKKEIKGEFINLSQQSNLTENEFKNARIQIKRINLIRKRGE